MRLLELSDSDIILNLIQKFNKLIDENNNKTNTLSSDQNAARKALRLNEVAKFKKDIDFMKQQKEVKELEIEVNNLKKAKNDRENKVDLINEKKRSLEAQAKDESKGAELVNQHLTHFFGHDELKLTAEGETPNMRFKITRGNVEAKNYVHDKTPIISK